MIIDDINVIIKDSLLDSTIDEKYNYKLSNMYLSLFNNKYFFLKGSFTELMRLFGIFGTYLSSSIYKVTKIKNSKSPAMIGDLIIFANGEPLDEFCFDSNIDVSLTIIRKNKLIKESIKTQSFNFQESYTLKEIDNIKYFKINNFNDDNIINEFSKIENNEKIVLDFTECLGGDLKIMIGCLEELIPKNNYLFSIKNKIHNLNILSSSQTMKKKANIKCIFSDKTASSAELFIIVLSYYYDLELEGEDSYGKATVISTRKIGEYYIVYPKYQILINDESYEDVGIGYMVKRWNNDNKNNKK